MSIRLFIACGLVVSAVTAGSVQGASAGSTGTCGSATAGGASWSITTINVSCGFAKSALPKLVAEKPYSQKGRGALIKPPTGWKACQVSFGRSGTTVRLIECSKVGTALIFTRK